MENLPGGAPVENLPPHQSSFQKYKPLLAQFLRFAVVGVLNTGIDFAIFNVLIYVTKISEGAGIIPIKAVAFLSANINSYLLNKKWTFNDSSSGQGAKQFSVYLSVSVIGALINIGTVYLITTFIDPMFNLSNELWANVANLLATGLSLVWNFIGYKLIVFKKGAAARQ
jgi:putative flippase GtrA